MQKVFVRNDSPDPKEERSLASPQIHMVQMRDLERQAYSLGLGQNQKALMFLLPGECNPRLSAFITRRILALASSTYSFSASFRNRLKDKYGLYCYN